VELKGNKGRGGYRPGGGRKPVVRQFSEKFKSDLLRALKLKAKETGRDVYMVLADMIYDGNTPAHVRANLFRLVSDVFVIKESHQTVERHDMGPVIGLPPVMEVPPEYRQKEEEIH
jgi:hypothetical protein